MNLPTTDFEAIEAELKNQLEALNQQRQLAELKRIDSLHDQLAESEEKANAYRSQAEKANSESDKVTLYRYADAEEQQAAEIRRELNLSGPTEPDSRAEQEKIHRAIQERLTDLFRFGAGYVVLFLIADYSSTQLEPGIFSYALHYVGQLAYFLGVGFVGVGLAAGMVWPFLKNNLTRLVSDWQQAGAVGRLALLAALIIGIIHFLTVLVPHGT